MLTLCTPCTSTPNVRNAISNVFGNHVIANHEKRSGKPARRSNAGGQSVSNTYFIEPLDYLPFVHLMSKAYLVLTDSGGIQEEAPGLGKPVLVMRDTTKRPEAIHAGTVKLVGTNKGTIIREVSDLINKDDQYEAISKANNPYGDGKACERVVETLKCRIQ